MFRWQRLLRLGLGLFAIVFAIGVYLQIRPRAPKPSDKTSAQMKDPTVSVESTAGEVILFKGSKQDVRIQYKTRITYQSGRTVFQGSRIIVLQRGGRDFQADSNEAEVAENTRRCGCRGR
jgi:hypothetical protein